MDTNTLKNESSTALVAENSKPKVPINGKKVKVIDTTSTKANENSTLLEKSIFSNFIESPVTHRERNILTWIGNSLHYAILRHRTSLTIFKLKGNWYCDPA